MTCLVEWRKQIMLPTLTEQQRNEYKVRIIKQIEEGSRMLDLDMIVRVAKGEKKGQRADEDNTGVVELFRQHAEQHKKLQEENRRRLEDVKRKDEHMKAGKMVCM